MLGRGISRNEEGTLVRQGKRRGERLYKQGEKRKKGRKFLRYEEDV